VAVVGGFPALGRPAIPAGQSGTPAQGNAVRVQPARPERSGPSMTAQRPPVPVLASSPDRTPPPRTPNFSGGQAWGARGIVRDRHVWAQTGRELSGRQSGGHDPMLDGPVRPSFNVLQRTWSKWSGTDQTRNLDDLAAPRPVNGQGKWTGTQGDAWTTIYGGTPGLYLPYGSRGTGFVSTQGEGVDGPQRIEGGAPHGLHTMTAAPMRARNARSRRTPQMVPGRVDRLANSKQAGQSYSQTTRHQGG